MHPARTRQAAKDLAAQIAWAECYDKKDFLAKKDPTQLKWDSYSDFYFGKEMIKLAPREATERLGNTGPRMKIDVRRRVFDKTKANIFIITAVLTPYIQFLGYMTREDMMKYVQIYSVPIYANTPELRPLYEWEALESRRIKGTYV